MRDLRIYLKGFWKRGNRAKAGKNPPKDYGGKYEEPPFTMAGLTTMAPYASRTI
jgi:hypothetical protein